MNLNCPLCEIDLNENNIIRLSCNPDKHYFCNDCIIDWFTTIHKNKNHLIQYKKRECPVCREPTKFIALVETQVYIKNIHSPLNLKKNINLNEDEITKIECNEFCNHLLKSKNSHCKNKGRTEYGGFCGIHKSANKQ
jgi:hypothetical protein